MSEVISFATNFFLLFNRPTTLIFMCLLISVLFQFCTEKVEVVTIEGNHRTILVGESGKKVATILKQLV